MSLFDELKRRNVIRVAAGYIVLAWLVVQVVETIFPAFGFGDEAVRFVVVGFAVGFIPVVVLAWVFEWTPQGIRVDEGDVEPGAANLAMAKRWDRIVMIILAVAVAFFMVENYLDRPVDVEPAVAVIPFEGAGLDPDLAFLQAGVPGGVHGSLARVPELVVSAWSTAKSLSADGLSAQEIAKKLKAPSVLEGTVRAAGEVFRIEVRLTDTKSGRAIWQETYEGVIADVFAIQDEITANVLAGLQVRRADSLPKVQRTNPETYRLTQQAWTINTRESGPGNHGSVARGLLEDALALDPDYIPAINALAYAAFNQARNGKIPRAEADAIWADAKERVLAIDPNDGVANIWLAWGLFWEQREIAHANQHLQIALRTGLNDLEALRMMAGFARRTGNAEAALLFGDRALAVDPMCENCQWQQTENLFYAGRFDEAIRAKERLQKIISGGYNNHAIMLLRGGDADGALEVIAGSDAPDQYLHIKAIAYHLQGDSEGFDDAVTRLSQTEKDHTEFYVAVVYAMTGDAERAFEVLWRVAEHYDRMQYEVFLPQFDSLRDDPRWTELRERLDISEQQVATLDFSPILESAP
ncbi:MAG: hypothetical protein QNJ23_03335 [Woeseiaceae bacterium]|nr:hypothetical protein [Woeseiaceae bacterium]